MTENNDYVPSGQDDASTPDSADGLAGRVFSPECAASIAKALVNWVQNPCRAVAVHPSTIPVRPYVDFDALRRRDYNSGTSQ